jgi:hypothetical protein
LCRFPLHRHAELIPARMPEEHAREVVAVGVAQPASRSALTAEALDCLEGP